jgi:sulfatase modifying factor 1
MFRKTKALCTIGFTVFIFSVPGARADKAVPANVALCSGYSGLPGGWGQDSHAGMVKIKSGEFHLGTRIGYTEERPEIKTKIKAFLMDQTEVTVAQFNAFVNATGYVTEAEKEGGGIVFRVPQEEEFEQISYPWWQYRKGANWRHPEGPESIAAANRPVTLVTLNDAEAYAHWLGRELPTEQEWEYAAKASEQDHDMEKEPRDKQGKPAANFWQGHFPLLNTKEDGYLGIAPVGCFPANRFGLYDMIGNVWEQTKDDYTASHALPAAFVQTSKTPKSNRPMAIKGGSHLCAQDYCVRYRPSAREAHEANLPMSHLGFRTVQHQD